MKNRSQKIKEIISQNKKLLEQSYNVKNIGILGSYAKGYIRKDSEKTIV
ncbi:MAG: hypothetical protein V2A64_05525 [Candidatus Omnitrophota bacterium]